MGSWCSVWSVESLVLNTPHPLSMFSGLAGSPSWHQKRVRNYLGRCRGKMAPIKQPKPDSGLGLQVIFLETCKGVPSSLGREHSCTRFAFSICHPPTYVSPNITSFVYEFRVAARCIWGIAGGPCVCVCVHTYIDGYIDR